MMSSCCTFRLKRRNAFSSGSPSCTRTSANELHLQTSQWGQFLEYGTAANTSQDIYFGAGAGHRQPGTIVRIWQARKALRAFLRRAKGTAAGSRGNVLGFLMPG